MSFFGAVTTYDCILSLLLDLVGGWACFVVSILWIGMLTAVIGDTASAFGCTIGLLDSVTAISFVALGTSVPGRGLYTAPHTFTADVILQIF